jgi:hypothetical protein
VPMEIPSDIPTVLNRRPTHPESTTPRLTSSERSSRCMLQGLPSNHTEHIPTCALDMSDSVMPVAYSIAWEAPWDAGWVRMLFWEGEAEEAFGGS